MESRQGAATNQTQPDPTARPSILSLYAGNFHGSSIGNQPWINRHFQKTREASDVDTYNPGAVEDATHIHTQGGSLLQAWHSLGGTAQSSGRRHDRIKPTREGPLLLSEASRATVDNASGVVAASGWGTRHLRQPYWSIDRSVGVWQPRCRCNSGES
eukprot:212745-Chlamydomonas_euryale.AAC.7